MPVNRLIVGMLTQDSPARGAPDGVNDRINQLRAGMREAFQLIPAPPPLPAAPGAAAPPAEPPGSTLRIFLAPEYFFRKNVERCRQAEASTAYTTAEKNAICTALQGMSRELDNLLIIGGSILWRDDSLGSAMARNSATVRNSLPIYYAGTLIHTYDKRNACRELYDFEDWPKLPYAFKTGAVPGVFDCATLSCGIETCLDHEKGQLKGEGVRDRDLHFIVSNTVTLSSDNVVAQPQGYVLHCNAGAGGGKVYQRPFGLDNGRIDRTDHERATASTNNLSVSIFHLPWPAR